MSSKYKSPIQNSKHLSSIASVPLNGGTSGFGGARKEKIWSDQKRYIMRLAARRLLITSVILETLGVALVDD